MPTLPHQEQPLEIGYIPGSHIPAIVFTHRLRFLRFRYVIVSCLDSDTNVSAMQHVVNALSAAGSAVEAVGSSLQVVIDEPALQYIINHFTGFDEVWFFDSAPSFNEPTPGITSERSLTDEKDPFVKDTLKLLPDWMRATHCTLGLGDGAGLNFVSTDPALTVLLQNTLIVS